MTKTILAIATAAFDVLASASVTAAPIARKAPPTPQVHSLRMQGACWWEPPVYYRYHAYFPFPHSAPRSRSNCGARPSMSGLLAWTVDGGRY
jgi:hypothetical protein